VQQPTSEVALKSLVRGIVGSNAAGDEIALEWAGRLRAGHLSAQTRKPIPVC